jgi:hypothetical protein
MTTEAEAIKNDAASRLAELRNVRAALWPSRDDAAVLSELVTIQSQIRAAEQALTTDGGQIT